MGKTPFRAIFSVLVLCIVVFIAGCAQNNMGGKINSKQRVRPSQNNRHDWLFCAENRGIERKDDHLLPIGKGRREAREVMMDY